MAMAHLRCTVWPLRALEVQTSDYGPSDFFYIPELPPFSFTQNLNVRIKQKHVFRSKFSPLFINVVEIGSLSLGKRTDAIQYVTCEILVKKIAYFCSIPGSGG